MAAGQLRLASDGGRVDVDTGSVFFVGTATVLVRYAGFTILTDPNFLHRGDHVHLGYGLRSRRLTEPAIDMGALPPLDVVLLSHLHEDHFDRLVERTLARVVPIVTTAHAARKLARKGFVAPQALDTWETLDVRKGPVRLRITAMPAKHGPTLVSRLLPPVMGSLLEFEANGETRFRLYVTGDTLVHDRIDEIPRRHPEIDLALVHLGGTRVIGVLVTMDGKQGVQLIRIVSPKRVVPLHYDDYTVFKSPLADFARTVTAAGLGPRVVYLARGETFTFRARPAVSARAGA